MPKIEYMHATLAESLDALDRLMSLRDRTASDDPNRSEYDAAIRRMLAAISHRASLITLADGESIHVGNDVQISNG
jgi:hypothetical protein